MRRSEAWLLLGSTAVALVGAEVALRLAWRPERERTVVQADPVYGWSLRPGARFHSVASDRGLEYDIAINHLGLRDRERDRERAPHVRRVLFLGDSMVFGAGVETGSRCNEHLERALGPEVEVWNAGVSGWGPDQEYLWLLREGFGDRPDAVVLGLCVLNDILNVMLPHELFGAAPKPRFTLTADGALMLRPPPPRPPPTASRRAAEVLRRSRLVHFVGRHLRLLRLKVHVPPARPAGSRPDYPENLESDASHWAVFRREYTPQFEAAFRTTEAILEAMHDSCAARGVPLVLFCWPEKVEVDAVDRAAELAHYGYDPAWFDLAAPYDRLRRLAAALDIPFVYPLEAWRLEAETAPLFFARDGHPNAAGHAAAARDLLPAVRTVLRETADPMVTKRR